jgi:hypothetical protein
MRSAVTAKSIAYSISFSSSGRAEGTSLEEEHHADVLAALQRMGEGEEARGRHAVAGVRVRAAEVEAHEAPDDTREHHREDADHEKRRGVGRGVVQQVEGSPEHAPSSPRRRGSSWIPVYTGMTGHFR